MSAQRKKLVVVGAGPAGLAAALAGDEAGLDVTLVDESAMSGGQYFRGRQHSEEAGSPRHFARLARNVSVLQGVAVVDAPADRCLTLCSGEGKAWTIEYDRLVIATGAYDRPVAIPGWTLPGVVAAGGASTFAKLNGVAPGRKLLVAGSGPFLLAVADDLSRIGCEIEMLEATPLSASIAGLRHIAADREVAVQTFGYLARLAMGRVKRRYGEIVTRIEGENRVVSATVSRVDSEWNPIPGSERTVVTDGVCLGFGFVPQLDLAQLVGCRLAYDASAASHFVVVDGAMRTILPGVYAAGEVTGIGGMRVAAAEGRLAGLTAAHDAGALPKEKYTALEAVVQRRLRAARRIADWIRTAFRPRAGLWKLAEADTIVCRCEDVRQSDADRAIKIGGPTTYSVKTITRAGMGLCQGRICAPYLMEWLRAERGLAMPADARPWRMRPPLRPVPLDAWPVEAGA